MNNLKILIQNNIKTSLNIAEIKYAFRVLLTIAGVKCEFVNNIDDLPDIYYGMELNNNIRLNIKMSSVFYLTEENCEPEKIISENNNYFFIFSGFSEKGIITGKDSAVIIDNDIIFTTYYLLSGTHEKNIKHNKKDQQVLETVLLYKNKLLHTPLINGYALLIKSFFEKTHQFIPLWPNHKKYAIIFSHDVDYPVMIKSIEICRHILKNKKIDLSIIAGIIRGKNNF